MATLDLRPRTAGNASVTKTRGGWHLETGAGDAHVYRLAQIDDYAQERRSAFNWHPPLRLSLRARISAGGLPGTWGFGLWNDPFGFGCSPGIGAFRLPTVPQAIWFFSASPMSYLSLRDDKTANGFFAQVFSSRPPGPWLAPLALSMAFDRVRARQSLSQRIAEDSAPIVCDPSQWHEYQIAWDGDGAALQVDSEVILRASMSPKPPLAVVIWIDNQFARFDGRGRLAWGLQASPRQTWLEVETVVCLPSAGRHDPRSKSAAKIS